MGEEVEEETQKQVELKVQEVEENVQEEEVDQGEMEKAEKFMMKRKSL